MAQVTNQEFVVAWVTSRTLDDVMKATGLSRSAASAKANNLRKAGVKLHKFTTREKLDDFAIAQLNAVVNKYKQEAQEAN